MPVLISVSWIFIKTFIFVDCAPKIGHVLFDPLAYEASNSRVGQESSESSDSYLSDDIVLNLRTKNDFIAESSKRAGYTFDGTKCLEVGDRLLCGYEKNIGEIISDDKIIDLGNGCQQRGDRIECGYVTGPFHVLRRPPGGNDFKRDLQHKIKIRHVVTNSSAQDTETTHLIKLRAVIPELKKTKAINQDFKIPTPSKTEFDKLETTEASTNKISATTAYSKTAEATETTSAKAFSPSIESNTVKEKSTLTREMNFTLTNNITLTSNTSNSKVTDEKTEITNVATNSALNATISTIVHENTESNSKVTGEETEITNVATNSALNASMSTIVHENTESNSKVTIEKTEITNIATNSAFNGTISTIAQENTENNSKVTGEKTEITNIAKKSALNATISTIAHENTEITKEPTDVYNLPKVETLREILRLRETRKTDEINTNTQTKTSVTAMSNTTTNNSFKTVCVEKKDRIFCYDFNV